MKYHELELFDYIGISPYTIESFFTFDCHMMMWANDRIRTTYTMGIK